MYFYVKKKLKKFDSGLIFFFWFYFTWIMNGKDVKVTYQHHHQICGEQL